MKERNNHQEKPISLPPVWCGAICRNAMNQVCIEHCAPKRDCSGFEEKTNLKLADMPRFPKTEGMSREEKFTSVIVYLAKVVDQLQEKDVEPAWFPSSRPMRVLYNKSAEAAAKISEGLNVLHDGNTFPETTVKPTRTEGEDE